jgi:hypothetical protein
VLGEGEEEVGGGDSGFPEGLPTSFTLVRRMGARFDGTLQICVFDGTSMRFRTSECDLYPLQESVLDNRREGVRNKNVLSPT